MKLALYRKYRPQTFEEVVGQEPIVQTLTNALRLGRISHAYLFTGPRGSGKTTLARLFAKAANCFSPKDGLPDNKCLNCQQYNAGSHMDLIEIDAASNRGIDEMRELREGTKFSPTQSKYKVFIIDEVHMLTKEAFNALLKTLEEPPSHIIFILATTEIQKVPPTIISRCQRFDFKKLTIDIIIKRLTKLAKLENIKIEPDALRLIAASAEGGLRDAESLLDQAGILKDKTITKEDVEMLLGRLDINLVLEFIELLSKKDTKGAIQYLNNLISEGHDITLFSKMLVEYARKMLVVKINPEMLESIAPECAKEQQEKLKALIGTFELKELQNFAEIFVGANTRAPRIPLPILALELAVVEFLSPKS
ncbi:DNA polymerase III subunit gamma/tau [Candidatus Parcubacteria bacterium]|nr:MAG: DNA polymerase III subunit gamma/tau [Candidatus Parcubacteria bacterium]